MKIKVGDKVMVIAGKDRGKIAAVTSVDKAKDMILVEGVNIAKKHVKPTENNKGGIVELSKPIHASNVMLMCPKTDKPTRVGYIGSGKEKKRICKVSQHVLNN